MKDLDQELNEWRGTFHESDLTAFKTIDRDIMEEIGELKKCLSEFDCHRLVWAEISANNVPPGRGSQLVKRLEIAQGNALRAIDSAAWRLRLKIRNRNP